MSLPLPVALMAARYGLHGGKPLSLEETAEIFGISRERVRAIETRVLAAERRRGKEHCKGRQAMDTPKGMNVLDLQVQEDGSVFAESTGLEMDQVRELMEKKLGKKFVLTEGRRTGDGTPRGGVLKSIWRPIEDPVRPGICKLCGLGCGPGFESCCSSCFARKALTNMPVFMLPEGARFDGCGGCSTLAAKATKLERELFAVKNGQNADLVQARIVNQRLGACLMKVQEDLRIERQAAIEREKETEKDFEDVDKEVERLEAACDAFRLQLKGMPGGLGQVQGEFDLQEQLDDALADHKTLMEANNSFAVQNKRLAGELELEKACREHLQEQLDKLQKPRPGIPVSTQLLILVVAAIAAFHALGLAGAVGWKLHGEEAPLVAPIEPGVTSVSAKDLAPLPRIVGAPVPPSFGWLSPKPRVIHSDGMNWTIEDAPVSSETR